MLGSDCWKPRSSVKLLSTSMSSRRDPELEPVGFLWCHLQGCPAAELLSLPRFLPRLPCQEYPPPFMFSPQSLLSEPFPEHPRFPVWTHSKCSINPECCFCCSVRIPASCSVLIKFLVESMHVDLPTSYICAHMLFCAPEIPLNMEHLPKLDLPFLCRLPVTTLPLCQLQTLERLGTRLTTAWRPASSREKGVWFSGSKLLGHPVTFLSVQTVPCCQQRRNKTSLCDFVYDTNFLGVGHMISGSATTHLVRNSLLSTNQRPQHLALMTMKFCVSSLCFSWLLCDVGRPSTRGLSEYIIP